MKRIVSLLLTAALAVSVCLTGAAAARFSDVPSSYWAYKEITWANEQGLMNGTASTTFNPGGKTLRGQMTAILYRYAGSPAVSGSVPYSDVSSTAYYADAAIWAKKNSILISTRLNAAQLNAGDAIGRAEFCAMVYNFAKYSGVDVSKTGSVPFTDTASLSSEYQTAIAWAYNNGIVNGTSATTFNPSGTLTRAAAAAMLYRYADRFDAPDEAEEPPKQDTTQTANDPSSVTLSKGANISVTIPVGKSIPLVDELGQSWTCQQDAAGRNTATITYDFGLKKQVLLGLAEGATTMTILSSADYKTVLATVKVTVGGAASGGSDSGSTSGSFDADDVDLDAYMDIRNEIVRLTNEVRRENGVAELPIDEATMKAAQAVAQYYAESQYTKINGAHNLSKEDELRRMYGISNEFSSNYTSFSETSDVAGKATGNWEKSPRHFSTMIHPTAGSTGVGVYKLGTVYYCVQFYNFNVG